MTGTATVPGELDRCQPAQPSPTHQQTSPHRGTGQACQADTQSIPWTIFQSKSVYSALLCALPS